ncbi:MAG: hypothetical protein ACRDF7_06890 [Candidatus Limnocylindrales bacterium]
MSAFTGALYALDASHGHVESPPPETAAGPHTIRIRERGNAAQPYIGCNQSQTSTVT